MKKLFIVICLILFATATQASTFNMPENNRKIPKHKSYNELGCKMVTQKMRAGGTISMCGYEKGRIQYVDMTFEDENRPYCWWFADKQTGESKGRCDIDNNGTYEYDFGSKSGSVGKRLHFRPQWRTAYE